MFDRYIICEEGFRRADRGGRIEVRMPYYRGLGLSVVEAVDLTFDGQPVPPERTTFTVHGHTYTFAEMPGVIDDRWEMGERAELAFETDQPLAPGEHDVAVSIRLRISYMPAPGPRPARLTAGAVVKLRDRDGWVPAALILVYAVLHARVPAPAISLAARLDELPRLFRAPEGESNPLSENYLGGPLSSADGNAFAAGAILDGLGPTLVLNAEYDHLRASSEAFTAAAAQAGVDVRQVLIRGLLHGFLNLPAEVAPVRQVTS